MPRCVGADGVVGHHRLPRARRPVSQQQRDEHPGPVLAARRSARPPGRQARRSEGPHRGGDLPDVAVQAAAVEVGEVALRGRVRARLPVDVDPRHPTGRPPARRTGARARTVSLPARRSTTRTTPYARAARHAVLVEPGERVGPHQRPLAGPRHRRRPAGRRGRGRWCSRSSSGHRPWRHPSTVHSPARGAANRRVAAGRLDPVSRRGAGRGGSAGADARARPCPRHGPRRSRRRVARRPRRAAGRPGAASCPVARVLVDVPLAHLDRPFDYLVPAELARRRAARGPGQGPLRRPGRRRLRARAGRRAATTRAG